jgi:hypothetical protein
VHVGAFEANQVEHAERGRQASGSHPNGPALSAPLSRSDPDAAVSLPRSLKQFGIHPNVNHSALVLASSLPQQRSMRRYIECLLMATQVLSTARGQYH